jgi:ComF family protein
MCETCLAYWTPVPRPVSCGFCGEAGSDRICGKCREHTYLDGLSVLAPYANPVLRSLIGSWKYHRDRSVETVLQRFLRQGQPYMAPPAHAWHVTSVPLHCRRKRSRGFDQASCVSEWTAALYGLPHAKFLRRIIHTLPQAGQTGRQVGELDNVFTVIPNVKIPEHVLLCDDVFTSGATMDACARVLKEAGAKQVWGYVLAKGS